MAQAQAVFERLWDQRAALNPKFVELAQRMKAAFPQYGDDWDLGSPKDLPNDAVLAVDIHDLGVFYPRLVDAAVALGLSVYDDSTGECFVPGPWLGWKILAYDLGEPRQAIAIKPYQANLVLAHWAGGADVERRFELLVQRCVQYNMTPYFLNATYRGLQGDSVQAMFGSRPGGTA